MLIHCPKCHAILRDDATECALCLWRLTQVAGGSVAERPETSARYDATVIFADLGGYTEWNQEEEPEEIAFALDRIKRMAVRVVEAHGGIVNQFVGDEIMGLFGVRTPHEDDPSRAVAAALALHELVRQERVLRRTGEPRALRLHTGVETGVVYARIRDARAGMYEVTGDTVNMAARLRSLAAADEVLVGPATHERIAPFFELMKLAPQKIRGRIEPIEPHRVLGVSESQSLFDAAAARGLTQYVNRTAEMAALSRAWENARAANAEIVTIAGLAGIGKTRLVHEFLHQIRSSTAPSMSLVLHGRCLSYGNMAPYQPFIDALARHFAKEPVAPQPADAQLARRLQQLGPLADSSVRVLAYLLAPDVARSQLPLDTHGESLRDAIVAALVDLVIACSTAQPMVLAFDDWHAADEVSRVALRAIAQAISGRRVLLLVNYRSSADMSPVSLPTTLSMDLLPLDSSCTESVASWVLRTRELPPGLPAYIHDHSLGNPFFVEEICRALLEQGAVVRQQAALRLAAPLRDLRTPATVQAIVRARIDRLPTTSRQLLRMAAVFGNEFSSELLHALLHAAPHEAQRESTSGALVCPTDVQGIEHELNELENQGLIYRSTAVPVTYRFKHGITQEVVYDALPLPERRTCHGRIAALIETRLESSGREGAYEVLARHYFLSSHLEKALEYALLAADKAWRSFSVEQADQQYRRAMQLFDRLGTPDAASRRRRIDASVFWGKVGVYNPHHDQVAALRASLRMAEELGDARGVCLCLSWMSWLEYALGDQPLAYEYSRRFVASAPTDEPLFRAQALTNLGLSQSLCMDYSAAIQSIEAGIRIRDRSRGTSQGYALGTIALIRGDQGSFTAAHALLDDAKDAVGNGKFITLLGPLLVKQGVVYAWQGDWDRCLATAAAAREIAERIDGRYIYAMSLALEGCAHINSEAHHAVERIEEASRLLEKHGIRLFLSWCYSLLAEAWLAIGDDRQASACATLAIRRAEVGDRAGEAAALLALCRISARAGRWPDAEQYFEQVVRCAEAKSSPRELAVARFRWAEVQIDRGPGHSANDLLQAAHTGFIEMSMPFHASRAAELLARKPP